MKRSCITFGEPDKDFDDIEGLAKQYGLTTKRWCTGEVTVLGDRYDVELFVRDTFKGDAEEVLFKCVKDV